MKDCYIFNCYNVSSVCNSPDVGSSTLENMLSTLTQTCCMNVKKLNFINPMNRDGEGKGVFELISKQHLLEQYRWKERNVAYWRNTECSFIWERLVVAVVNIYMYIDIDIYSSSLAHKLLYKLDIQRRALKDKK